MTCGDNVQCSKSKVQRKITKQSEHGTLKKKRRGSDAMENEHPLLTESMKMERSVYT